MGMLGMLGMLGAIVCIGFAAVVLLWVQDYFNGWWERLRADAQPTLETIKEKVMPPPEPGPSPTRIPDGPELVEWFRKRKCCPDCGSTTVIQGPSGGMSQNTLCVECHSEFNLTLPYFADRLPDPDAERLRCIYGIQPGDYPLLEN